MADIENNIKKDSDDEIKNHRNNSDESVTNKHLSEVKLTQEQNAEANKEESQVILNQPDVCLRTSDNNTAKIVSEVDEIRNSRIMKTRGNIHYKKKVRKKISKLL